MFTRSFIAATALLLFFAACEKTDTPAEEGPMLTFKLELDPNQVRLDNLARPQPMAAGHAGQDPDFKGLSAHFIELVPTIYTLVGEGAIVYKGKETTAGGATAVDFSEAIVAKNGEVFVSVPLKDIPAGTYPHLRVSVTYQNYEVLFNINNVPNGMGGTINLPQQRGTIASFVGFNTYITDVQPNTMTRPINANKRQGFWAFETSLSQPYQAANNVYMGDAPGTTVVNPLSSTAPIPAGSCLVTGSFDAAKPLVITGDETEDIVVNLAFSINNSFEWEDDNSNGELDLDVSTGIMEKVVDMGLRGLQPSVE